MDETLACRARPPFILPRLSPAATAPLAARPGRRSYSVAELGYQRHGAPSAAARAGGGRMAGGARAQERRCLDPPLLAAAGPTNLAPTPDLPPP